MEQFPNTYFARLPRSRDKFLACPVIDFRSPSRKHVDRSWPVLSSSSAGGLFEVWRSSPRCRCRTVGPVCRKNSGTTAPPLPSLYYNNPSRVHPFQLRPPTRLNSLTVISPTVSSILFGRKRFYFILFFFFGDILEIFSRMF